MNRAQPPLRTQHAAGLLAPCGLALLVLLALLTGCAGTPRGGSPGRDGPPEQVPADLSGVPDAEPRLEPIRPGGANKPYVLFGRFYQPLPADAPLRESGLASWYGRAFHGRATASGEPYDMFAMTAAHTTLPIPSYVRVRNPANGREVIVRVNDRGPFHADRIIDLSYTAAMKLDLLRGVRPVEIERITPQDIRSGAWRRPSDTAVAQASAPVVAAAPAPAPAPASQAPAPAPTPVFAAPVAAAIAEPIPVVAPAEPVVTALPAPATSSSPTPPAEAAPGFWLQLGAFREIEGARSLAQRLAGEVADLVPRLTVLSDERLHRLQAGPYRSRAEAQGAAAKLQQRLSITPVLVQRR